MPQTLTNLDLSVFNVDIEDDGTFVDYLGLIQNVTLSGDVDTVDTAPITRAYDRQQGVKKSWSVSAPVMSVKTGSTKVTNLDLSAISLFGTSYASNLKEGSFTIAWNLADATGAADLWRYNQPTGTKTLTFEGRILVPATGGQDIQTKMFANNVTDIEGTVTFTINGVTVTAAMVLKRFNQVFSRGDLQEFDVTFEASSPDSGTYPAAPTGTTTLLERALNTVGRHRLQLTSHASEGIAYAGNAVLRQARIVIPQAGLLNVEYEWAGQGALTATAN